MAEEWMIDYNAEHSHDSLGKLTPIEFLERYNQIMEKSPYRLSEIWGGLQGDRYFK